MSGKTDKEVAIWRSRDIKVENTKRWNILFSVFVWERRSVDLPIVTSQSKLGRMIIRRSRQTIKHRYIYRTRLFMTPQTIEGGGLAHQQAVTQQLENNRGCGAHGLIPVRHISREICCRSSGIIGIDNPHFFSKYRLRDGIDGDQNEQNSAENHEKTRGSLMWRFG